MKTKDEVLSILNERLAKEEETFKIIVKSYNIPMDRPITRFHPGSTAYVDCSAIIETLQIAIGLVEQIEN